MKKLPLFSRTHMKKLQLSLLLMVATILLLVAFEGYWLHKLYKDEYAGLRKEVDISFRETMNKLQIRRFEKDTSLVGEAFVPAGPAKTTIIKSNTNVAKARKPDAFQPSTFVYHNLNAPNTLKSLPADSIESVTVRKGYESGFSFKGAPNPVLVELIMKQAQGLVDSAKRRIIIQVDSTMTESLGNRVTQKVKGVTINLNTNDSATIARLQDSFYKVSHTITPRVIPVMTIARKPQVKTVRKDSVVQDLDSVVVFSQQGKTQPTASPIIRFLSTNKTINDSIPVAVVDSAYRSELTKTNKKLKFKILFESYKDSLPQIWNFKRDSSEAVMTDKVFVGYNTPYSYQAEFEQTGSYVLSKMQMQIGGSLILLLLVAGSFIILYRNLLTQRRLADIKNDFISNITHELKTPIATVGVAIEALRNFNAIQSPERTKEYLDISAAELQRLSLLVDKVLKLSMFEKQQIELNKEPFDLKELMDETLKIMKLQFEKHKATVNFTASDNSFMIEADKLHITSVIYNLLDNALKYSGNKPQIDLFLEMPSPELVEMKVKDDGMGIAAHHQEKIFEKFFRVPTGDKHNIKGYGLGLSYVAEVVKSHHGAITLESEPGKGTTFIVQLPVRD